MRHLSVVTPDGDTKAAVHSCSYRYRHLFPGNEAEAAQFSTGA